VKSIEQRASDALADLCRRYSLDEAQCERLAVLLDMLCRDPAAPTTIRNPLAAIDMHLADSLAGLEVERLVRAATIADLGSGAGLPGLPLAVALPGGTVSLIESQGRKCAFLEAVVMAAGVGNAEVVNLRAERWGGGLARQDAVVARALAAPAVVAEYAAPLLRLGGVLVDWRGRRDPTEEQAALTAISALGLARQEVRRVQPFPAAEDRHLHVYVKVRETPPRFPRRPGIARKRPLGAAKSVSTGTLTAADRARR
jgi:16S rRNA (guanine527-N7)-methyltransferase